jgi:hypothetical protein
MSRRVASRRSRALGVAMLAAGLASCHTGFGPTPSTFDPAQRPEGVRATLRIEGSGAEMDGEVLEVRDSALLILAETPPRVRLVPIDRIRLAEFHQTRVRVSRGRFSTDDGRELIRRLSRFPAGLPEERLRELLEVYGQQVAEPVG